jgi:hypothetical protein
MSKLPINRIVAFAGPYIAILSGAVVDWLFVHLHFLTNWHTNASSITKWLTQALVFGLTSLLVWLGQQSWLKGWIEWESKVQKQIAATPVPEGAQAQIAKQAEAKPVPVQEARKP